MKENLLTIGQLAQITNTHIKALRYYEKIGILLPTTIDPANRYRYYAASNILYVNIIKLCIENGLPLKRLHNYLTPNRNEIQLSALIDEAHRLVTQKQNLLQQQLEFLSSIKEEILLSEKVHLHQTLIRTLPSTTYWCVPFTGTFFNYDYFRLVQSERQKLAQNTIMTTTRNGLLFYKTKDQCLQYLMIEIEQSEPTISHLPPLSTEHSSAAKQAPTIAKLFEQLVNDPIQPYGQWLHLPHRTITMEHVEVPQLNRLLSEESVLKTPILALETYEEQYQLKTTHVEIQKILLHNA